MPLTLSISLPSRLYDELRRISDALNAQTVQVKRVADSFDGANVELPDELGAQLTAAKDALETSADGLSTAVTENT